MRFYFSGPRIFGIRPGVSFGRAPAESWQVVNSALAEAVASAPRASGSTPPVASADELAEHHDP
jgi:hypothetical protein